MRFMKGHGTENDFVIVPDPDGELEITAERVARICDRRAGIGADGLLRVVRAKAAGREGAEWFMDYRNSDGSLAEVCGNGVRVFARYLVDSGLAEPGEWPLATRAGLRRVTVGRDGDVRVDMGPPAVLGRGAAQVDGIAYDGWRISMGNPHLACPVDGPISNLELTRPPVFDATVFPEGVNVELYRPVAERHVEMRVYERGSGETRSCGTGAVATAVAAALDPSGTLVPGEWLVDVPGGRLTVTLDGRTSYLAGPAVLVAEGELHI